MTDVTQTQVLDSSAPDGLDEAIADAEEQLGLVFGRARVFFKEAARQIHPDLQPVGYKVLSSIVRLGETNAHALAELLETDKSILSRQVRMLEEAGLVESRADAKDGRARVLSPTPAALERVRAVRAAHHERLSSLLRSRSEDDVRAFASILRSLNQL